MAESVLVLDGESNQALACVRSLGRRGDCVSVASCWSRPLASWSRFCQHHFRLRSYSLESFAELHEYAISRHIQYILPLTERSCILCNEYREKWEREGLRIGCGPRDMLERAFDKAITVKTAATCGVRIPNTAYPRSLADCRDAAEQFGWPCVVKPRFSNAWNGSSFLPDRSCAYVDSYDALDRAVTQRIQGDVWPLIQGFVPGVGKGVFALCHQGQAVAWFAHERLRDVRPTGSGSSLRRSISVEPRLRNPAERLLSALEWSGPAMVEFRDDGEQPPCLMEVNGRFWTSLQLAISAGVDFPRLWMDILRGESVPRCDQYQEGVTLRWFWGDVKRFLHILAGRPSGFADRFPTRWQGFRELCGRQPARTRLEMWEADDPWPAVGEWVQGFKQILAKSN